MKVGLVLGAGGAAGEAFHRGVIRAMDDVGLDSRHADIVVGTSAGSMVAASLRRGSPQVEVASGQEARRSAGGLSRSGALALVRRPRQLLNAALLAPEFLQGEVSTDFITEALSRRHGRTWPTDPLWIVAVRRKDGARVIFGKPGEPPADIASAVGASCAIPGYFSAVTIDGVEYVDGGIHSPTNADVLAAAPGLDLVVISSPMSVDLRHSGLRLDLPLRVLFARYLHSEMWTLRRRGTRVLAIEPDGTVGAAMGLNMLSARRSDEIEDEAYELAHQRLKTSLRA